MQLREASLELLVGEERVEEGGHVHASVSHVERRERGRTTERRRERNRPLVPSNRVMREGERLQRGGPVPFREHRTELDDRLWREAAPIELHRLERARQGSERAHQPEQCRLLELSVVREVEHREGCARIRQHVDERCHRRPRRVRVGGDVVEPKGIHVCREA